MEVQERLLIDPSNEKSIMYKCEFQKIQVKAFVWKNDQLLFLHITVGRFSKRTRLLDWFFNAPFHLIGFLLEGSLR